MIRILIADDHAIVRSGLKMIFEQVADFEVVGDTANGSELMEWLRKGLPDIVLLDMDMPGISGADLIARLQSSWPGLPLLVLSMHNEPKIALQALKAGASGYITKDSDLDILLPAVRAVAEHRKYIAPGLAEKMVFEEAPATRSGLLALLTDREMQVFSLLVNGSSVNEIAFQLAISNKTVSTHKAKMMDKLNQGSIPELMRYAMLNGFVN